MGCFYSTEEDTPVPTVTLAERKAQAMANRQGATSVFHNLVHEEFGR